MNDDLSYDLRSARAGDAELIRTIVRRARLDRTGLDWRNFVVAEAADGQVLGICQVRRYPGVRELGSLFVGQRFRHQGIGAALIRACLEGQKPPVHLECLETRATYYHRFGFQRIAFRHAPLLLGLKSLVGSVATGLVLGQRVVVMRWDG